MIYKKTNKINIFSWIYSLLIIVFLMFTLSVITSSYGYKIETWQDYATYDFEQEISIDANGEEVITNLISTPEQLAGYFAMQSNSGVHAEDFTDYFNSSNSYKLKNNINLEGRTWTPQSNSGTLDGNFFTIEKLTISYNNSNVGFVSTNYGTIKNIFFKDVSIINAKTDGKSSKTGTVCGYNYSGTIDSVTVLSGTIKGNYYNNTNEDRRVGGICGYNYGTITHCINHATINRGKFLGGIAGVSKKKIENCYNYGSVSAPEENQWPRLGGIVGENESGASISLCLNYGEVNSYFTTNNNQPSFGDLRIGGIVGHSSVAVSKCGNYGNVTGGRIKVSGQNVDLGKSYVGGVVGYIDNSISDCFNKGSVFSYAPIKEELIYEGKQKSAPYDGGKTNNMYASNLVNKVRRYDYYAYAGGICARCVNNISYCYNTGTITGGFRYYEHYDYAYLYQYGYRNGWDEFWNHARDVIINSAILSARTAYCTDSYVDGICPNKDCTVSSCYYSEKTRISTNGITIDEIKILQYRYVCAGVTKEDIISLNDLLYTRGPGGGSFGYSSGNCYIAGFDFYFWCPWGRFNYTLLCREKNADDDKIDRYFATGYCWYDYIICSVCDVEFNILSCNGTQSSSINSTSIKDSLGSNWNISSNYNDGYPYVIGMYW